jgi:hypothetical protein
MDFTVVKDLYEKLYRKLKGWIYGSFRDVVNPLGSSLVTEDGAFDGFFSPEEITDILALHRTIQKEIDSQKGMRRVLKYAKVRIGDTFDPSIHTDIYGPPGKVITHIMWHGIDGHTPSYVMTDYSPTDAAKTFYEFLMTARLPVDLKRFLFDDRVQSVIKIRDYRAANDTGQPLRMGAYMAQPLQQNWELIELCQEILYLYFSTGGKAGDDPELAEFATQILKSPTHRCDMKIGAITDLCLAVIGLEALCVAIGGPCTVNSIIDDGKRICRGLSHVALSSMVDNNLYIRPCTANTIFGIPNILPNEHQFKSTLKVYGETLDEMMQYVIRDAHVFTYRVDMQECHTLNYPEMDALVDAIRQRCPFVRHVVCRLNATISIVPPSFNYWRSLILCDLTLSPGILCYPARDSQVDSFNYGSFVLIGTQKKRPPLILSHHVFIWQPFPSVRLISRLSCDSQVDLSMLLSLTNSPSLITPADGPVVQAIVVDHRKDTIMRLVVTIHKDRNEFERLVPQCQRYKDGVCDACRAAQSIGQDRSQPRYDGMLCLVSCQRSTIDGFPIRDRVRAGVYPRERFADEYFPLDEDGERDYDAVCEDPDRPAGPEEETPLLRRAVLTLNQETEDFSSRRVAHRKQCGICYNKLSQMDRRVFPICCTNCVGRNNVLARSCLKCESCMDRKMEADIFCFDVCLANCQWREMFAIEVMRVIRVRGDEFMSVVVIDDTGPGPLCATVEDAQELISLLLFDINTTTLVLSQSATWNTPLSLPGDIIELEMFGQIACGRWVLEYILIARSSPGPGVCIIGDIAAKCPFIIDSPDRQDGVDLTLFRQLLETFRKVGLINIIGETVFLSMRHYATFLKFVQSTASSLGRPDEHSLTPSERGHVSFTVHCEHILDYLYAKVRNGEAPDIMAMIQTLVLARRAAYNAQEQADDEATAHAIRMYQQSRKDDDDDDDDDNDDD